MTDITPEMIEAAKSAYWSEAHHGGGYSDRCYEAAIQAALCLLDKPEPVDGWYDGAPGKPWAEEWFIAETTWGDRVVLTALPEEWSYDFKTADDTYIKADKIKRWMQFPDSQYIAPAPADTDAAQSARRKAFEEVGQKAREYAAHYPEASDGRNTFIIFAEWAEGRP